MTFASSSVKTGGGESGATQFSKGELTISMHYVNCDIHFLREDNWQSGTIYTYTSSRNW